MMGKHKITAIRSGTQNGMDFENEYEITFTATKGSPDYWNRAGGHWEQGWAPEIEFVSISPGAGDHGAFTAMAQRDLEDWAEDWLNSGDNDAEIYAIMREDDDAEREAAAEMRAEMRAEDRRADR